MKAPFRFYRGQGSCGAQARLPIGEDISPLCSKKPAQSCGRLQCPRVPGERRRVLSVRAQVAADALTS